MNRTISCRTPIMSSFGDEDRSRYDPSTMSQLENGADADDPFDEHEINAALVEMRSRSVVHSRAILTIFFAVAVAISVVLLTRYSAPGGNNNSLVDPPGTLGITCAASNLLTDIGRTSCLTACQPASCCEIIAESPFSCLETDRDKCEIYRASCENLQVHAATQEDHPDNVCSTTSRLTSKGVEACEEACADYTCCFDGSSSCSISEAVCADMGACQSMHVVYPDGFSSNAQAKESVDTLCSNLKTYEDQEKCTNVCKPGVCCFLSPNAWDHSTCDVDCDHYDKCSVLYGTNQHPDQHAQEPEPAEPDRTVTEELSVKCSPGALKNLDGAHECLEACQHHMCCFEESGSCLDDNPKECPLYSPCHILLSPDDPVPAEQTCSVQSIESHGTLPCFSFMLRRTVLLFPRPLLMFSNQSEM